MNDHIAGEDLAAYADGVLKAEQKAGLESHLSRCPECLDALAEIVDIRSSRAEIPGEFLRRALGEKPIPEKTVLPMRLVFGIAAVFLVAVVIGYYFLDFNRLGRTVTVLKERSGPGAVPTAPLKSPAAGKPAPAPVIRAELAGDVKVEKGLRTKGAVAHPSPVSLPDKKTDAIAVPEEEKLMAAADEPAQEQERVREQVAAPQAAYEKDKSAGLKTASAGSAALPARAESYKMNDSLRFRSLPGEAAAVAGAVQLFLAATGRASAPLAVEIAALAPRTSIRIAGDVSRADLRDSGLLDSWSWLQKGLVLELDIDAAGAVTAVRRIGPWDERAAALAETAARELRFSVSGRRSRRAVLTASTLPPN
jgi:hypothetical protein